MFDQIVPHPYYRKKHLEAPFLEERLQYLQYGIDRGLSFYSLRSTASCLLRVVKFLHLEVGRKVTLNEIENAANNLALYNYSKEKTRFSEESKKIFIRCAVDWLKKLNWLEELYTEKNSLFNTLYKDHRALQRHIDAPLFEERLKYLQHLFDGGAKKNTLRVVAAYLLVIMDYLNFFKLRQISLDEINKAGYRWLTNEKIYQRKARFSKHAKERFVWNATQWLDSLNCLEKIVKKSIPFEEYLTQYVKFMREEQNLSEYTIIGRVSQLQRFFIHIDEKQKNFMEVTACFLDKFLTEEYSINKYSRNTIQFYLSNIKAFLRYAQNKKWCQKNLAESIKSPRKYKYETLPSAPNWEDVKKLLSDTKTDYSKDIRDYAILMLLSVYGMRRSEVKHLKLEDIDWENEIIHIKRAKGSKSQMFPLSQPVGEAILNYIKNVRQNNCSSREIFLCMKAPYRALCSGSITVIVNRRLKPLNLNIKHHGAHALRHACATHLINEGISLKEISDYLGHQELDTTRIYAKVDLTNLRKISADLQLGDLL